MTSLTSSSDSEDEAVPQSNQLMPSTRQVKKTKTRAMQIGIKHRTNIKFKLPIQDMHAKAGHTISHDFEPIIIEEVFFHGRVAEQDFRNSMKLITPQLIFDRARIIQAGT